MRNCCALPPGLSVGFSCGVGQREHWSLGWKTITMLQLESKNIISDIVPVCWGAAVSRDALLSQRGGGFSDTGSGRLKLW